MREDQGMASRGLECDMEAGGTGARLPTRIQLRPMNAGGRRGPRAIARARGAEEVHALSRVIPSRVIHSHIRAIRPISPIVRTCWRTSTRAERQTADKTHPSLTTTDTFTRASAPYTSPDAVVGELCGFSQLATRPLHEPPTVTRASDRYTGLRRPAGPRPSLPEHPRGGHRG